MDDKFVFRNPLDNFLLWFLIKQMRMSVPSIYAAFGNKKNLFLKSLDLYVGHISDISSFVDNSPSAFEATYDMLKRSAVRFTGNKTPRGCMLASATASCSSVLI
jgi:hypothetical protein